MPMQQTVKSFSFLEIWNASISIHDTEQNREIV